MDRIDIYSVDMEITKPEGFTRAVDAVAWAFEKFGEPTNHASSGTWGLDAKNGKFIFDFMNKDDCILFVLTWC